MSDIIKLYNPANSGTLTAEDLQGLQKLTSSEIKSLAQAYPNATMQRAYLLIIDGSKPVEKQLPALSSFENLWNLRERNGLKQFVAYAFKGSYKPVSVVKSKRNEVVDLSDKELLTLPGFKTDNIENPSEKAQVHRIGKTVTEPIQVKSRHDRFIIDNPDPEEAIVKGKRKQKPQ